jgi:hypothetical protein
MCSKFRFTIYMSLADFKRTPLAARTALNIRLTDYVQAFELHESDEFRDITFFNNFNTTVSNVQWPKKLVRLTFGY